MFVIARRAMGLAGLVALSAATLHGQEPTVLRGRVLSEVEGRPVAAVQLRFATGQRVLTDQEGRFEVQGLPAGDHRVLLVTSRCRYTYGMVRVVLGTTWETNLSLPEAYALAPSPDIPQPETREGTFLAADDLAEVRGRSLADVVRRVAPEMVEGPAGQPGRVSALRGRNRATVSGLTRPVVVVDGSTVADGPRLLSELRPTDVQAIHVVPGASGAWKYGSSGGLIQVWTRRGSGGEVGGAEACPDPLPSDSGPHEFP
jgi:hypothetical protein